MGNAIGEHWIVHYVCGPIAHARQDVSVDKSCAHIYSGLKILWQPVVSGRAISLPPASMHPGLCRLLDMNFGEHPF
jgi:hypothetical protein